MIQPGFKAPWNKDGWKTPGEAEQKEIRKAVKRPANYEDLARIYANLLINQATIIRNKQNELKRRKGTAVPKGLEITTDEMDWMLKAVKAISACRYEEKQAKEEAKKKTRDTFSDPRVGEPEDQNGVEGGWEADGRNA